jgi:hypothetical protein
MDQLQAYSRTFAILAAASVPFLMLPLPRSLPVNYVAESSVPSITTIPDSVSVNIVSATTVLYKDSLDGAGAYCTCQSCLKLYVNIATL